MYQGNIGDNSTQCANTVVLSIQSGATVTVANAAASVGTVSVQSNGLENASVSSITPGNNASFSVPGVFLTSTGGISSVTITGTGY